MAIFIGPGNIPMNSQGLLLLLCYLLFHFQGHWLELRQFIDMSFYVIRVSPDCLLARVLGVWRIG